MKIQTQLNFSTFYSTAVQIWTTIYSSSSNAYLHSVFHLEQVDIPSDIHNGMIQEDSDIGMHKYWFPHNIHWRLQAKMAKNDFKHWHWHWDWDCKICAWNSICSHLVYTELILKYKTSISYWHFVNDTKHLMLKMHILYGSFCFLFTGAKDFSKSWLVDVVLIKNHSNFLLNLAIPCKWKWKMSHLLSLPVLLM